MRAAPYKLCAIIPIESTASTNVTVCAVLFMQHSDFGVNSAVKCHKILDSFRFYGIIEVYVIWRYKRMKFWKRLTACALTAAMAAGFAGCGSSGGDASKKKIPIRKTQ